VQSCIGHSAQARLELVVPPPHERQVSVTVHEPRDQAASRPITDGGRPRKIIRATHEHEHARLIPGDGGVIDDRGGESFVPDGKRARRGCQRRGDGGASAAHRSILDVRLIAGSVAALHDPVWLPVCERLARMRVSRSVVLPTTMRAAWDVLMDWERQADWMLDADRVTVLSDIREGVGVRLAVRTRVFGVPAFTEQIEVVEWSPPHRLVIVHGGPIAGTGIWTLVPTEGGVAFTWIEDITLAIPVVGELAVRIYGSVVRILIGRSMDGLRRHVIAIGPPGRSTSMPPA